MVGYGQRDLRVRPALLTDALAIAEAHVRSWQETYAGMLPDSYLEHLSVDERANAWRRILAEEVHGHGSGVLVLETADPSVVGFTHYCRSRDHDASNRVGEITAIYVRAALWRQGGGSALLSAASDALCAAGFTEATLWVLEANLRARRFYESRGWKLDGGRKHRPGDGAGVEVRYRLRTFA